MRRPKKKTRMFVKIFAYTMLLLALMSLAAVGLFARQFLSFYQAEQQRQLSLAYQPMINAITDRGKSPEEIMVIARTFAGNNQSFRFIIQGNDGKVFFSTPGIEDLDLQGEDAPGGLRIRIATLTGVNRNQENAPGGYLFTGYLSGAEIDYGNLAGRCLLALGIMIIIACLGAVLFAKKVTKPLEDELERERVMEENQRLFFSAASHELKTPIAAARALVEGMIANVGDYRNHPKYLRECIKTLDSQTRLVSEILGIVKLDENTAAVPAILDLTELCASLLDEYRPIAEQRGLSIQAELEGRNVRADRELLRRALSNVIANAVQNSPQGEAVRLEMEDRGQSLRLKILNTGARIPEEQLPRLFDPFYRLDTARTRNNAKSGLGLAIVKKALDRMGIPFALENTDAGVLFWLDLPVVHPEKVSYPAIPGQLQENFR